MELENLAFLIAEDFLTVMAEAFDKMMQPEPDDETIPKVMTAGR